MRWTPKKRTIGLILTVLGIVGAAGIIVLDVLRTHQEIGPSQKAALLGCAALAAIGISVALFGKDQAEAVNEQAAEAPRWSVWIRRAVLGVAAAFMAFHLIVFVIYTI